MKDRDLEGCYEAIKNGSHSFYAAAKLYQKMFETPLPYFMHSAGLLMIV